MIGREVSLVRRTLERFPLATFPQLLASIAQGSDQRANQYGSLFALEAPRGALFAF